MDPRFGVIVDRLAPKLDELLAMEPLRHGQTLPSSLPQSGVYLFSKDERHFYVGRSNNLRKRFRSHFKPGRGSAFAFLLARKATGISRNYKKGSGGTRNELSVNSVFRSALENAFNQMKEMEFRCVSEEDSVAQALLEIYCAVVLKTEHNDFDNH